MPSLWVGDGLLRISKFLVLNFRLFMQNSTIFSPYAPFQSGITYKKRKVASAYGKSSTNWLNFFSGNRTTFMEIITRIWQYQNFQIFQHILSIPKNKIRISDISMSCWCWWCPRSVIFSPQKKHTQSSFKRIYFTRYTSRGMERSDRLSLIRVSVWSIYFKKAK